MYESFYGLKGKPFHLTPDPEFFFESTGHARALAYLHYGVEQGEGLVVVTGDVGTGKTTLARMLYEELERSKDVVVAQLSMTQCDSDMLLHMIARGFGIKSEGRDRASLLADFEAFLRTQHAAGRRALLLIDEAQNLPFEVLEMLRMLTNLQVGKKSLLQTLLLGQVEFRETLLAPTSKQLRQRVVACHHLLPLAAVGETRAYIEHRLYHVGWKGDPRFSREAYARIEHFTNGIPRRINTFCDRLLLYGFLEEVHAVTAATVDAVAEEIARDLPAIAEHDVRPGNGAKSPPGNGAKPPPGNGATTQPSNGAAAPPVASQLALLEERVRILEIALQGARDSMNRAYPQNS